MKFRTTCQDYQEGGTAVSYSNLSLDDVPASLEIKPPSFVLWSFIGSNCFLYS